MKVSPLFPYHPVFRWLGLALIAFAVFGIGWQIFHKTFVSAEAPLQILSVGIVFIFFSREKMDDERIHQIKYKSLCWAVLTSFLFQTGINFSGFEISASGLLVMILSLATGFYYFMKSRS